MSGTAQNTLRLRGVRPFLVSSFTANTGTEISGIIIPLVAITVLEASNAWVATIEAVAAIVMLVIALPIGLIVDRQNRRRLLISSYLLGAFLIALIPVLWFFGALTVVWLLVAAVALQVLGVLSDLVTDTVVPSLVPNGQMDKVNGIYASSRSVAEVGGAGLGGALISAFGLFAGLLINAATFLFSALLAFRLPPEKFEGVQAENETAVKPTKDIKSRAKQIAADVGAGFTFYLQKPRLRLILASSVTSNVFSTVAGTVEFLYLIRVLEVPAWGVGVAVGVTAVGGILGGLCNSFFVRLFGSVRVMLVTQLVLNVPILLLPLAFPGIGVVYYLAGWFFYSFSSVIYASAVITYRQRVVPLNMLGRVGAASRWINSLAIAGAAIVTAATLTSVEIWPVVLVSSVGIYASGFWLLNRHFWQNSPEDTELSLRRGGESSR